MQDCWYDGVKNRDEKFEVELEKRKKFENSYIRPNQIMTISEPLDGIPERFFMFTINGKQVIGTKLLSDLIIEYNHPGLFCSKIIENMILGELVSFRINSASVDLTYKSFSDRDKKRIFDSLSEREDVNIFFPFRHISEGKERTSPSDGWFLTPEREALLSLGEVHLRKISINFLASFDLKEKLIYDPACSSGVFLNSLKNEYSEANYLGQDLSEEMVKTAKTRLENVVCRDASHPSAKKESVDFIFSRFLNSEVVTTRQADDLFKTLWECLKIGGHMVVFGHTPVLIDYSIFDSISCEVVGCNKKVEDFICQYYVIKKV